MFFTFMKFGDGVFGQIIFFASITLHLRSSKCGIIQTTFCFVLPTFFHRSSAPLTFNTNWHQRTYIEHCCDLKNMLYFIIYTGKEMMNANIRDISVNRNSHNVTYYELLRLNILNGKYQIVMICKIRFVSFNIDQFWISLDRKVASLFTLFCRKWQFPISSCEFTFTVINWTGGKYQSLQLHKHRWYNCRTNLFSCT